MKRNIVSGLISVPLILILYQFYCFEKMDFTGIMSVVFYYGVLAILVMLAIFAYWRKIKYGKILFTCMIILFLPMNYYYDLISNIQKNKAFEKGNLIAKSLELYKKDHSQYPSHLSQLGNIDTSYYVGFIKYSIRYAIMKVDVYWLTIKIGGQQEYFFSPKRGEWDQYD